MNKLKVTIVILLALGLFAGADYYLNNLSTVSSGPSQNTTAPPKTTSSYFKLNDQINGYKIINQVQTNQIFEKIDLSNVPNITIYRNQLKKETTTSTKPSTDTDANKSPKLPTVKKAAPKIPTQAITSSNPGKIIHLYEIQGTKGQGSITYSNVKIQFLSQINTATESLNETTPFSNNSFFFNNSNYKNIAFLLIQINDKLFAFQYDKEDSGVYDDVKSIINKLLI